MYGLQAEDDNTALVLRLYEAYGGEVSAKVTIRLPVKQAHR